MLWCPAFKTKTPHGFNWQHESSVQCLLCKPQLHNISEEFLYMIKQLWLLMTVHNLYTYLPEYFFHK